MNSPRERALKSLTPRSSLTMLLRAFYQAMVDYCAILPLGDSSSESLILFNKDQLVTLIERDSEDSLVADIPRLIEEGMFKPGVTQYRDIAERGLPVIFIEEDGAVLTTLKEAQSSYSPKFPAWWEAPVPFLLRKAGKLYSNEAAKALLGDDESRLSRSFPRDDKEEFLVELTKDKDSRSFVFRRLDGEVFIIEECDSDEANDIVWWAATGRAWIASLAKDGRVCRRFEKREIETLLAEELGALVSENSLFPCEWGGERLGYLCVENKKPLKEAPKEKKRAQPLRRAAPKKKDDSLRDSKENETLRILGPQAMGLLAPGQVNEDSNKDA
ncbi:hypothetical protein AGMMS50276_18560 [Synergistales bacterium]|nr:hypothetical protein AGMMS50276_18560 [Synergistales bacterium]